MLKGQEWGKPGGIPVLALHGWLDNSASFTPLMPLLHNIHCVSLDLAGHGHSDHRSGYAGYSLLDDVVDIFAVADQLGWQQFALLGHSRGAMISFLAAGTLPERISQLIMLDAMIPQITDDHHAPTRMANSIVELHSRGQAKKRVYDSLEHALDIRCASPFAISRDAAALLASRGVMQVDNGYSWRSDNKLQATSSIGLNQAQIEAYGDRITMPAHLLVGKQGLSHPQMGQRMEAMYNACMSMADRLAIEPVFIDGGHYLHMDESVDQVAQLINCYL